MCNVTLIRMLTHDLIKTCSCSLADFYIVAELSSRTDLTFSSCLKLLTLGLAFSILLTVDSSRKQTDAALKTSMNKLRRVQFAFVAHAFVFTHNCPSNVTVWHCVNKPVSIRASWGKTQEMEPGVLCVVALALSERRDRELPMALPVL